ncbi:MAG: S41 family peptidase [Alphaproteobacteria bacterium]|nr:S41 family peptidase [Alphaproteobacteria bacterium]
MKTLIHLFTYSLFLLVAPLAQASLFDERYPIQQGINVFEISAVFADIYERLDAVNWAGRDIRIALESLDKVHPDAHVALTGNRAVLVFRGDIIGNWPRPSDRDWAAFGQITTAMIVRLREHIPEIRRLNDGDLFNLVVGALMAGIDQDGRYIFSLRDEIANDGRLLTSAGIEGIMDERGNFRVTGVFSGSVAAEQGIRGGDLITAINGRRTSDMQDGEVAAAFAGFNSGTIRVRVLNASGDRNITLRRATVIITDADVIWRDPILEIVVNRVSDNSAQIINEAIQRFNPSGIILDMRTAHGDDERAAAKLAGLFIGRLPVLRSVETAHRETEIVPGANSITNARVVVVVSTGTRGTGEAIAAAMHEHGRAVVIGTPTAGRARLATRINLNNGGALEVMNRIIKTQSGRDLDGRGFFPIVCLSNIRSEEQQGAFFVNVINNDFGARDFNAEDIDASVIRRGCPQIASGADEDAVAMAIAVQILSDERVFNNLMNN